MIKTAEEFKKLRSSENLDEQRRAGVEEASIETWQEVIQKYPELKKWVIYNKTIPLEILNHLSKDCNPEIRSEVARKRKIDSEIFDRLKIDQDENVKLSLLYNRKLSEEQKDQINTAGSVWYQRQVFQIRKFASDSKKEIELFGYNQYWIELGIVDEYKIKDDLLKFKEGEDSDPDHFRHRRLMDWLKNKNETNQLEIESICELVKNDIDISYANNVITEIYNSEFIKPEQRIVLESKIENLSPFLKTFAAKSKIKRKISKNDLTKIELAKLVEEESNSLLKLLVDNTQDIETLKILAKYEGSKKVRNVAIEKMKKAGNNGL